MNISEIYYLGKKKPKHQTLCIERSEKLRCKMLQVTQNTHAVMHVGSYPRLHCVTLPLPAK